MWQFPMFEAPNTLEQLENKLGMSLSIAEEIVFKLKTSIHSYDLGY